MSVNTARRVERDSEMEQILREYLPYIRYSASRLSWRLPPHMTVDDLISAGIIGLLNALERYREELGRLDSYVKKKIRWAMLDELRANEEVSRNTKDKINALKNATLQVKNELGREPEAEEVAERMGVSLEEYYGILQSLHSSFTLRFEDFTDRNDDNLDVQETIRDESLEDPLEVYERKKLKESLERAIEELTDREKLVLSLYDWEELTMKEVAEVLGVTEGRVSQIHHQALLKLKTKMRLWKE